MDVVWGYFVISFVGGLFLIVRLVCVWWLVDCFDDCLLDWLFVGICFACVCLVLFIVMVLIVVFIICNCWFAVLLIGLLMFVGFDCFGCCFV